MLPTSERQPTFFSTQDHGTFKTGKLPSNPAPPPITHLTPPILPGASALGATPRASTRGL